MQLFPSEVRTDYNNINITLMEILNAIMPIICISISVASGFILKPVCSRGIATERYEWFNNRLTPWFMKHLLPEVDPTFPVLLTHAWFATTHICILNEMGFLRDRP